MTTWLLEGYSTDGRSDDVRYRDYTTSQKKADAFRRVPKIRFTDSGHGIVFSARELRPGERRLPKVRILADHVQEHMKL